MENFELTHDSVKLLEYEGWSSPMLIAFLTINQVIGHTVKILIIRFVVFFAPEGRPLNKLILLDQVNKSLNSYSRH